MLANYFGYPSEITTVLEGIREKLGNDVELIYEKGVNLVNEFVFTPYKDSSA